MKNLKKLLLCAATSVLLAPGYAAADGGFPVVTSIETNYVGMGVGWLPDYTGSDDYEFGVLPAFRYQFGNERFVQVTGNYGSANLFDHENFRFGPALRYRFGREDVDDAAVSLLPDIDDTLEAGFTVGGNWLMEDNPRDRLNISFDTLWDTGSTYSGFNSSLTAQYWMQASEAIDVGLAGVLQYGDENFTDTYFGITPAGSAASGLPAFNADDGIASVSIQPMMAFHLNENWHIGAGLRYMRLTSDAADSPVTDTRGSADQLIGGLGVVYSWGTKVHQR